MTKKPSDGHASPHPPPPLLPTFEARKTCADGLGRPADGAAAPFERAAAAAAMEAAPAGAGSNRFMFETLPRRNTPGQRSNSQAASNAICFLRASFNHGFSSSVMSDATLCNGSPQHKDQEAVFHLWGSSAFACPERARSPAPIHHRRGILPKGGLPSLLLGPVAPGLPAEQLRPLPLLLQLLLLL
eukprot:CAMPEP_0206544708 /NCGR_PEP_ID=MMETSP0325_2-20121206/11699_1 /ASSEMBLY_ACC=CAM_ASM_000347 /TAXON_ID=2866 /ORGANISM="Crypthecodinium cohnii, Strain Seligo" /LENGTH=185 /DNA_ID=CAMNT_0054043549 /DNA_START=319 /DNA_END=874 /DNA_ORIENTATION=-